MTSLPYLSAADVAARLTPLAAVDALEAALRGGLDVDADPPRANVAIPGGGLLVMPSAAAGSATVKLVTVGGEPRIQGVCVVFDRETLAPAALIDAIALTNLRTAAVSALAVRHLAVPEPVRAVIFGRGPQAHAHADALRAVRPSLADVTLLGRDADPERAAALVRAADVVCCCTTARAPLFDGSLVADHATVIAIGSHEPDAREVDTGLARRATVVVESREAALREAGDVILAGLGPDDLTPLADVVRGATQVDPRRPRLFKSVGMAWQDAVVAAALTARGQ